MAVLQSGYTKAKELYKTVLPGNAVAQGLVATAALSGTRQTYVNPTISFWNDTTAWNSQGQRWAALNGSNPAAGCMNRGTNRNLFGTYFHHIADAETMFTGDKLDVQVWGTSASGKETGFDLMVWIEGPLGQMIRVVADPVGANTTAMQYFNIDFGYWYSGRVHVTAGACAFVGIGHDTSAIMQPSPNRYLMIDDGDSYFEPQQAQNAGNPSTERAFWCMNQATLLWEATGFAQANRAEGATGFFANAASSNITDDSPGLYGAARWFAAGRLSYMSADFAAKPLIYLLNGTWNDGTHTQGQAGMYARAKYGYGAVRALDPYITIVHVLCEPYWGDSAGGYGAAGTNTGPPTAGSIHANNIAGQRQAMTEVANVWEINPFGPTLPWFTGKGDITTLATTDSGSPQAHLTGSDHIHGVYAGYWHYSRRIARDMGELPVLTARVKGTL